MQRLARVTWVGGSCHRTEPGRARPAPAPARARARAKPWSLRGLSTIVAARYQLSGWSNSRPAWLIPLRCALRGPALGPHPRPRCLALRRWGSGWAAQRAGRHWPQGLRRAAEVLAASRACRDSSGGHDRRDGDDRARRRRRELGHEPDAQSQHREETYPLAVPPRVPLRRVDPRNETGTTRAAGAARRRIPAQPTGPCPCLRPRMRGWLRSGGGVEPRADPGWIRAGRNGKARAPRGLPGGGGPRKAGGWPRGRSVR